MSDFKYTIGRSKESDIVLNHASVSKVHAYITVFYYDQCRIEDAESKNGTYVNGRKIKSKIIKPDKDKIRFGDYTPDLFSFYESIYQKYKNDKADFTREYQEMLSHFRKYQKKLDQLNSPPKGPLLLRLGLGMFFILILVFYPDLIPHDGARYAILIGIGIISMASGVLTNSTGKRRMKLAKLRLEYIDLLICPKCKMKLINENLAYWEGRKKCENDKCKAIFQ